MPNIIAFDGDHCISTGALVTAAHEIKIYLDNSQRIASIYQVTSIPTLVLFKKGVEVDRMVGVQKAKDIKERIEKVL